MYSPRPTASRSSTSDSSTRNDKATHLLDLFYRQMLFGVLPDHFLLHERHELASWADDEVRKKKLNEIFKLTEKFNFQSGLYNGVNFRTSKKIPKGSYREKKGRIIEWDGERWVDRKTREEVDPLSRLL